MRQYTEHEQIMIGKLLEALKPLSRQQRGEFLGAFSDWNEMNGFGKVIPNEYAVKLDNGAWIQFEIES